MTVRRSLNRSNSEKELRASLLLTSLSDCSSTRIFKRTHTYRNIWTTANQKGGPHFTISDWFRPRYKPNVSVGEQQRLWVAETFFFFFFCKWLDAPVRPTFFFLSHPWEIRSHVRPNWSHSRALEKWHGIFNDHRESRPRFNVSSERRCLLTVVCPHHYTGALGPTQTRGWAPPAGLTNTSSSSNLVFSGGLPSRYWPGSTLLSFSG